MAQPQIASPLKISPFPSPSLSIHSLSSPSTPSISTASTSLSGGVATSYSPSTSVASSSFILHSSHLPHNHSHHALRSLSSSASVSHSHLSNSLLPLTTSASPHPSTSTSTSSSSGSRKASVSLKLFKETTSSADPTPSSSSDNHHRQVSPKKHSSRSQSRTSSPLESPRSPFFSSSNGMGPGPGAGRRSRSSGLVSENTSESPGRDGLPEFVLPGAALTDDPAFASNVDSALEVARGREKAKGKEREVDPALEKALLEEDEELDGEVTPPLSIASVAAATHIQPSSPTNPTPSTSFFKPLPTPPLENSDPSLSRSSSTSSTRSKPLPVRPPINTVSHPPYQPSHLQSSTTDALPAPSTSSRTLIAIGHWDAASSVSGTDGGGEESLSEWTEEDYTTSDESSTGSSASDEEDGAEDEDFEFSLNVLPLPSQPTSPLGGTAQLQPRPSNKRGGKLLDKTGRSAAIVPLEPFDHQVGGHSHIFRFSKKAVCKVCCVFTRSTSYRVAGCSDFISFAWAAIGKSRE